MTWILFALMAAMAAVTALGLVYRKQLLAREQASDRERAHAKSIGSHRARLQHPHIDLSACLGCGTCVTACPEDGVLDMLHGQAAVVHGARCVGHGRCAEACPVDAITITLEGLDERRDIPAVTDELEAVGQQGLFLAGELGGFALVRTALAQGSAVGSVVAQRVRLRRGARRSMATPTETRVPASRVAVGAASNSRSGSVSTAVARDETQATLRPGAHPTSSSVPLDLLIIGAGPAGLACALAAREAGLEFAVIDQATDIGGTVASYPRRKLVMTQPVALPLGVALDRLEYSKEDLIEMWERVVREHRLPVRTGVRLTELRRDTSRDTWHATTTVGDIRADHVCLALGRRGSPRKLGVPGEDLPKVAYGLIDAHSYRDRRILVVGGGDSAVEAALGLAEQPGNTVTISYRKPAFFRLKGRNQQNLDAALAAGRLRIEFGTEVRSITADAVELTHDNGAVRRIDNDDVFVFAGGVAPFELVERAGVSFDPADRPPVEPLVDRGAAGLLRVACGVLACAFAVAIWAWLFRDYYEQHPRIRPLAEQHRWLAARGTVGLWCGLIACAAFVWNLLYLVRRSPRLGAKLPGKLSTWMTSHVATGITAWLLVLVHAGLQPIWTVGGFAFLALSVVVVTGTIGRYLYAHVPRAANGAEADIEHLHSQLAAISGEWDRVGASSGGAGFAREVRARIDGLLEQDRWRTSFFARVRALLQSRRMLRHARAELVARGRAESIPESEIERLLALADDLHRITFMATHFSELRNLLSTWRYLHRWLALLMVLLAIVHIVTAVRFGEIDWTVLFGAKPR